MNFFQFSFIKKIYPFYRSLQHKAHVLCPELKGLWHTSAHDALFWRTFFQDWLLVKKSSSINPEKPEKAIISVFKSYLVHFGSFKCHIVYFCASIVEKIRSHWGEVQKPCSLLSVFLQTDQVWRVMWSSGFHFCLLSSPVNDLPFADSS